MTRRLALEWKRLPLKGHFSIQRGTIVGGAVVHGEGWFDVSTLSFSGSGPGRIALEVRADNIHPGMNPTLIRVRNEAGSFTFFLRDAAKGFPIFIPNYGVAVTEADDSRRYEQIESNIRQKGLQSIFQRIDGGSEESFDSAAVAVRKLESPVWLGIGRDVRIFELGLRKPMLYTDYVQPRFHGYGYFWPEEEQEYMPRRYGFVMGRGWHCEERVRRWLEDGVLPIVHTERNEGDVCYHQVAFAALERSPLTLETIRGTHYLVADWACVCNVLTDLEQNRLAELKTAELKTDEETIFFSRITATNTGSVPRYVFFKAPFPHKFAGDPAPHGFDREQGFGLVENSDRVYAVSRFNGQPLGQEEIAVLLSPGQRCEFEFILPHRPIAPDRAKGLIHRDIHRALDECRGFWNTKLDLGGKIQVPEKRIDEMVRAGLVHLDLTAYGREPDGPVAMTNGVYVPVASEVWVNINYFDSLGLHTLARRCLDYYFCKQRDDGFIQTFTGYMLENGGVLLALGEHYRYTRDDAWLRQIKPKVIKACEYILACREKARAEEVGFGILRGQVADPVDCEQNYMLNAYAWAGLASAARMLAAVDSEESERIGRQACELRSDIQKAFWSSLAEGPVIPLGDGTWSPTAGPWFGTSGPKCLFTDGESWWTHGSMSVRDDIIGPMHLVSRGVFEPDDPAANMVLNYQSELMFTRNVASSQPYYSQHPLVHLRRGEVKRFLKAYYSAMAALADREIYSWWEHFYHESPHKTHEEAEFLMQTRWMLYLEDGETLRLLAGVPRAWFEDGKRIEVTNMISYFGPLSFTVESKFGAGRIEIHVTCNSDRKPAGLEIRVPHPAGMKARRVEGGTYDPVMEKVTVEDFKGTAEINVFF